jgi:hypothetical protein
MKTSNKILLGAFLTAMLIIASIHITLYAKYKRGEYKIAEDEMWLPNMLTYPLADVKYVSLENLENINISQGDSTKLQYEKADEDDDNILSVTKNHDTLFLKGQSVGKTEGRWYRRTNLTLAGLLPLRAINSRMYMHQPKNAGTPISFDILLDSSFLEVNRSQRDTIQFDAFNINAVKNSRVYLFKATTKFLNLHLNNSSFEEDDFVTDSISVMTDSDSRLKMSAGNLVKAKIVPNE